jgi:hypothetical protein
LPIGRRSGSSSRRFITNFQNFARGMPAFPRAIGGYDMGIQLWPAPHFVIWICDWCHSWSDFGVRFMSSDDYGLATLPYLYRLRASMIAHESTHSYQRELTNSKASLPD